MRPHAILDQSGGIYLQGQAVTIDCDNLADADILVNWLLGIDADHPNAQDYRNRGERDAAYWRELCERLAKPLMNAADILDDECFMASARECRAVLAEYEAARINVEALR